MLRNKGTKVFSEIADFFASDEKAILTLLGLYQNMHIDRFKIGVKDQPQGKYPKMDILLTLLLSPLSCNDRYTKNGLYTWFKKILDSEKDVMYRFMNDCRVNWRSIVGRINSKLISYISKEHSSEACLILDDTDLRKTGFKIELISRIWSHVENRAVLGFKGLFLAWCDDKNSMALDFSLHREKGKNEKYPFGLKANEFDEQYRKERSSRSSGAKRVKEADMKKTDNGISMIKRALSAGIPFGYVLMDSWFVSINMIRAILGMPGKHFLGMGKMGNTKYRFQGRDYTAGELAYNFTRNKKDRRIRSLKLRCLVIPVYFQDVPVTLFFYRNTRKGPWHFLISTDQNLTPVKAYRLYAKRWIIEIYFKEAKGFFGLGGCQSRDFDAQIAHTAVIMIAYNMFSVAKRLNHYDTMGDLFREVSAQMTELSLADRIWICIQEILVLVAELFDVNVQELIQRVIQSKDDDSKLRSILTYCTASAA